VYSDFDGVEIVFPDAGGARTSESVGACAQRLRHVEAAVHCVAHLYVRFKQTDIRVVNSD